VHGTHDFDANDVGSLVPASFAAFARVFHPAMRRDGDDWPSVPWSAVADANGRTAHPAMEWIGITGDWRYLHGDSQPGTWDLEPAEGSLPLAEAAVLAKVLARFTSRAARCWFAVWEGSGAAAWPTDTAAKVMMPHRQMGLFEGPLEGITTSFDDPPFDQRANLWWPDDRQWCVATEVDLMTTYVGASPECIQVVVDSDGLEARQVLVHQKLAWDSDTVNPAPTGRTQE
jgi:hypothetical protein